MYFCPHVNVALTRLQLLNFCTPCVLPSKPMVRPRNEKGPYTVVIKLGADLLSVLLSDY